MPLVVGIAFIFIIMALVINCSRNVLIQPNNMADMFIAMDMAEALVHDPSLCSVLLEITMLKNRGFARADLGLRLL